MNMTISTRQVVSITILDIGGRIVLREESVSVRDVIRNLLNNGHKQILFNLGHVDLHRHHGLGFSGGCLHDCAETGWRPKTSQPPREVRRRNANYKTI